MSKVILVIPVSSSPQHSRQATQTDIETKAQLNTFSLRREFLGMFTPFPPDLRALLESAGPSLHILPLVTFSVHERSSLQVFRVL